MDIYGAAAASGACQKAIQRYMMHWLVRSGV